MKDRPVAEDRVDGRHVRVRELLRTPGEQHRVIGAFALEAGSLSSARLRDDVEATYELVMEAQGARVQVRGRARGAWTGPCRRCLEPTGGDLDAGIDEIFDVASVEGETWPITDGMIDLEPVLREAMLLELPVAPLCRPDCVGPDPERYPATSAPDEEHTVRDPRWAALEGVTIDDPVGRPG